MDRVLVRDFDRDQTAPCGAANRVPDASHSQTISPVYARQQPCVASSKPVCTDAAVIGTAAHPGAVYTTAGAQTYVTGDLMDSGTFWTKSRSFIHCFGNVSHKRATHPSERRTPPEYYAS